MNLQPFAFHSRFVHCTTLPMITYISSCIDLSHSEWMQLNFRLGHIVKLISEFDMLFSIMGSDGLCVLMDVALSYYIRTDDPAPESLSPNLTHANMQDREEIEMDRERGWMRERGGVADCVRLSIPSFVIMREWWRIRAKDAVKVSPCFVLIAHKRQNDCVGQRTTRRPTDYQTPPFTPTALNKWTATVSLCQRKKRQNKRKARLREETEGKTRVVACKPSRAGQKRWRYIKTLNYGWGAKVTTTSVTPIWLRTDPALWLNLITAPVHLWLWPAYAWVCITLCGCTVSVCFVS